MSLAAQVGGAAHAPVAPSGPQGTVRGVRIGEARHDTGFVARLPRNEATGHAAYAIELDTFDFRRKWTLRLVVPGPDSLEVVLRYGDSVAPRPRTYPLTLLATGRSHLRDSFTGDLREWDGARWQSFILDGSHDSVTIASLQAVAVSGSVALLGGRLGYATPTRPARARWRYRGLAGSFSALPGPAAPSRAITPADEDRIMLRAIDGLMITWIGAINGDGTLEDRTVHGVREFVLRRWGTTLAVDSVTISGMELWIRLHGVHHGRRCEQSTSDVAAACGWMPGKGQ